MKVKDLIEELCYGELSGTSLLAIDAPKLTDTALVRVIIAINDAMTELAYEIPYYTNSITFELKDLNNGIEMPEDMCNTYTQILRATLITGNNLVDLNINVEDGDTRSPSLLFEEGNKLRIGGIHSSTNSSISYLKVTYAGTPPLLDIKKAKEYIKENSTYTLKIPRMLWAILKVLIASKALLNAGSVNGVQLAQVYAQKYSAMIQQMTTKDLINTSKVHNPNYLKRYGFL